MQIILLQNLSTKETREVTKAVALSDKDSFSIVRVDISDLKNHRKDLVYGAVPIGSVEFCREAMKVAGIKEPTIDPYPNISWIPYYRVITKLPASFALSMTDNMFIKPTKLKRFNGFVYNKSIPVMELSDHDKEQVKILMKIPDTEQVYISDVVDFASEFRYYIDSNEVIGFSRYDDSDEEGDHLIPDLSVVKNFAIKVNKQHPYVLDFGVLKSGETALVELNHFYAIGLYQDGISAKEYLRLLVKYWDFIRS
jgi:ATP-grasp domain, R2K clade family 3